MVSFGLLFKKATLLVRSRIRDLLLPSLDRAIVDTLWLWVASYLLKAVWVNAARTFLLVSSITRTMFGMLSMNSCGLPGDNLSSLKISFVFLIGSFFMRLISSKRKVLDSGFRKLHSAKTSSDVSGLLSPLSVILEGRKDLLSEIRL